MNMSMLLPYYDHSKSKDTVLKIIEDAYCVQKISNQKEVIFSIKSKEGITLGVSFINEEHAWSWALSKINIMMKRKMES